MCSTLTVDNADITMQAMKIGAIDYIAKPSSTGEASTSDDFRDRLVYLIKQIRKSKLGLTHGKPQAVSSTPKMAGMDVAQNIVTRIEPPLHWKAKILAIGSSTGGPQALFELMQGLKGFKLPIVITQHMPPTFTNLLAKHITDNTGVECAEAMQGMKLEPGKAVLAQGGKHMVFTLDTTGQVFVELNDDAPINFCKPAVDPMLESLNEIYDGAVMTAILTGMGHDGLDGVQKTTQSGGYCVAQNQETSIVWGMPGAVANAGLCSAVLPLSDMAKWIKDHI
jgi:two-component system chemotaxis response regulator CheB